MQAFERRDGDGGRPRPPHQFFIIELRSDRHFSLSSGRSLGRSVEESATFSPLTASGAPSCRSLLPALPRRCTTGG